MSGKPANNGMKASEELHDPWATDASKPTTSAPRSATTSSSSSSSSGQPSRPITSALPPSDVSAARLSGKIDYPCYVPAAVGAGMGAVGGALVNIFGKQPATVGAVQGAATMLVVSTVSCVLIKQRDGSIYEPSWDRTIAYAAGGFVWPMVSGGVGQPSHRGHIRSSCRCDELVRG
jgi:hypothetical protein